MCLGIEISYEVKLSTYMHTKKHERLVYFDKNGYSSYISLIITSLFKNYILFMLEKSF